MMKKAIELLPVVMTIPVCADLIRRLTAGIPVMLTKAVLLVRLVRNKIQWEIPTVLSSPEIKLWFQKFAGLATEWQITAEPIASRPSSSLNQIYGIERKDTCVEEVVSRKLYLQIRPRSAEHCARRACGVVRG